MHYNYCGSHNCSWIYEGCREQRRKTEMYMCNECDMINIWKSKAIPINKIKEVKPEGETLGEYYKRTKKV